ncbi:MAG: M50 family metallopeptidase [Anaerolineae bacterium]|nr:M50 family metallopeptidase [Anaerolineae bacterium]
MNIKSLFDSSVREEFSSHQTLTLIGLAGLVSLLMAFIPWLDWLNYPFRLLLTMVHELGHGLAALLTGGEFIRFVIFPSGAGLAYTAGGWRWVIVPAGYVGVAVFGAILIRLDRSQQWSRMALAVIGGLMGLLSLRYGVPSIISSDFLSGLLTTVSGLVFGGFFIWVALKARPGWIVFLLHLVAIQAGLTAFSDLMTVMGLSLNFFNAPANDARSMAELTFIPAIIWAVLWAGLAAVLIGGAIWVTWVAGGEER